MTTLAIIGSRGFLAKHFCREMDARADVRLVAIDRPAADVGDLASLTAALNAADADVVINFAAISFAGGGDERAFYEVNAFGEANVLKALAAADFRGRHIFISSGNVYGATTDMSHESDAPAPVNHYGCSKVLAENFCNFLGGAFTTHIVRPFNCIGAGQPVHFLAPKIVDAFRRRADELVIGNLAVERDFLDARDFARMLAMLALDGSMHRVLNFCNGETVSIQSLIDTATRVSGHNLVVRSDAQFQRSNDLVRQLGDNARIRETGYVRRHSIEDTIGWMLSA